MPSTSEIRGVEVHTRMRWEGVTLVFESGYTHNGEKTDVLVRYRLEDEGQTFVAEEQMVSGDRRHRNTWVFARQ